MSASNMDTQSPSKDEDKKIIEECHKELIAFAHFIENGVGTVAKGVDPQLVQCIVNALKQGGEQHIRQQQQQQQQLLVERQPTVSSEPRVRTNEQGQLHSHDADPASAIINSAPPVSQQRAAQLDPLSLLAFNYSQNDDEDDTEEPMDVSEAIHSKTDSSKVIVLDGDTTDDEEEDDDDNDQDHINCHNVKHEDEEEDEDDNEEEDNDEEEDDDEEEDMIQDQLEAILKLLKQKNRRKSHECRKCQTKFENKAKLSRHLSAAYCDNMIFSCPRCNQGFTRKYSMLRHWSRGKKCSGKIAQGLLEREQLRKEV